MSGVLEIVEPLEAVAETASRRMTFEEFLNFGDEDTWAEWIDGEIIQMYSASTKHQEIVLFLAQVLGLFVRTHNLGEILLAPFAMKLEKERRGREPDLLFVSKSRKHLIEPTFLNGAADVVIEVISPESVERDRGEKFIEYESAGVKEYWLIDYERKRAEFYELDDEGLYRLIQTNGVFHSKIIEGFFLRENWFWQEILPTIEALQEMKIIS